jgi:hypothetical protein
MEAYIVLGIITFMVALLLGLDWYQGRQDRKHKRHG